MSCIYPYIFKTTRATNVLARSFDIYNLKVLCFSVPALPNVKTCTILTSPSGSQVMIVDAEVPTSQDVC